MGLQVPVVMETGFAPLCLFVRRGGFERHANLSSFSFVTKQLKYVIFYVRVFVRLYVRVFARVNA